MLMNKILFTSKCIMKHNYNYFSSNYHSAMWLFFDDHHDAIFLFTSIY